MSKISAFLKKNKKFLLIGTPILLVVLFFMFGRGNGKAELYTVEKADVSQSVVLSGKVETSDRADLGFAAFGRLGQIFIKNNQSVNKGQILAQLEIGDLLADLKIKEANSRTSDVSLEAAKKELENVTILEDEKVKSAYRNLLSDDLELIPNSTNYDAEPPTLGGIYDGAEGKYKIRITKDDVTSTEFKLLTFDLEKTNVVVNEEGGTPLGTRGLYISFPDGELSDYNDTEWSLQIPNKSGSFYLSNWNAYNEAKKARDLAVKEAESEYEKLLSEEEGGDSVVAQAEIQKINAEIRKNTIYAPFKGRVTNIEKEVGENASTNERVISILGEEKLEVVLQVSELDVSRLSPGVSVKISLDAFPGEDFYGTLETINSRETEVDGVPVYEAFVELKSDERIKTGMTVRGTVVLATKTDVLVIPSYLITKEGDKNFVEVMQEDGATIKKEITLGLSGTDSMVEVTSGLELGEKIVSNADEK